MSNTPEFSNDQLAAARSAAWHQNGAPILTLEAARDFITMNGLVLFTPRAGQLPAAAPSFVEATMGASASDPAPEAIARALALVGRLVLEGSALALNLLGGTQDAPDFIVSAQAFSFLYTLRGDKNWKQPPATTGATKSSPLGVRVFEVLAEKGALSAAELATELGRELTESAVQRSLAELWSNLRVLPLYGQGDAPVLWELATRRFTKAIKSGVNAGQPTALSALISLYLAQALLATEEEIEVFLSPLSARSRIREVAHALTNARQLEIVVLDGKSLLHVPGTLPEFPAAQEPAGGEAAEVSAKQNSTAEVRSPDVRSMAASASPMVQGEGRIKRFTPAADKPARGEFRGRPARPSSGRGDRPAFRAESRAGGDRPNNRARKPEAERRPFQRSATNKPPFGKPSFSKPWEEERKTRAPRAEGEGFSGKRPYTPRPEATRPEAPRQEATRPGAARREAGRPEAAQAGGQPFAARADARANRPAKPPFPRPSKFAESSATEHTPNEHTPNENVPTARPYRRFDAPRRAPGASRGFDRPARQDRADSSGRSARPTDRPYSSKREGFSGRAGKPWQGAREDGAKPRAPRAGFSKPGFDKPGFSKPGFSKPGFSKAGFSKPGFPKQAGAKPGFSKSAFPKPGFDRRPEQGSRPARSGSSSDAGRAAFGEKRGFGDRAQPSGFSGGDRPRAPKKSSFSGSRGGSDRPGAAKRSGGSRPSFGAGRPGASGFSGGRLRKPAESFARRPAGGGKVPSGPKPPRGVNPRTANRATAKREPRAEE